MSRTISTDVVNPELLTEAVRGQFAQKGAFMGAGVKQIGACVVSGSMPEGGPKAIGQTVKVPYFNYIGDFVANNETTSGTFMSSFSPNKIAQTSETSSISRDSLFFEVSQWAQGNALVNPAVGNPYEEAARQAEASASRAMDKRIITAASAAGAPAKDYYSSSSPRTLDWDMLVDSMFELWGDEQDEIAGIITHSQGKKDILKLKDSTGRPLLLESQREGDVDIFCGLPLIVSDRVTITGSAMGSVTASGTTPPTVTLSGTPLGTFRLQIDIVVGGSLGTATFRFSTDGGNTWSATMATGASIPLTDTAIDSLVGVNGATGVTAAFAAGTYNADNLYTSTTSLKAQTLVVKKNSLAFWYASGHLGLQTDRDIAVDSDLGAMHLYAVAHRYRRKSGSTKCGVIQITHNVSGYS